MNTFADPEDDYEETDAEMMDWPHRLNPDKSENEFLMFVSKNRNREIRRRVVKCSIDAGRQKINAAAAPWESAADSFT